ncbi:hypothetical protein [Dokdonia sp.]|uniref:hypothetical protein n=1 Tax=Dokdonia sp. TaxID=2024995 RepID=UPI0032640ED8
MNKKIISLVILIIIVFFSFKTYSLSNELKDNYNKIKLLEEDIARTEGNTKRMNMGVFNKNAKEFNSIINSFPNNIINSTFLNYETIVYKKE